MFFIQFGHAQDLEKRITLKVDKASLPDVLQQIHKKYRIRFSYLNNELSRDTINNFHLEEKPLSEVLDKLLEKSGANYKLHNGQIIIKKGYSPAKKENTSQENVPVKKKESASIKSLPAESIEREVIAENVNDPVKAEKDSASSPIQTVEEPATLSLPEATPTPPKEPQASASPKTKIEGKAVENPSTDSTLKPIHFGFVYPISNYGLKATDYKYRFSIHTLIGVSGGLEGLEFTGVGSIQNDSVKGAQFSGVFNLVGDYVEGGQFAGVINTSGGGLKGAQFSGLLNINGQSMHGGQFAGFGNFSRGTAKGVQSAGFINIAKSLNGVQVAGFQNSAREVAGGQIGGFINTAQQIKGIQIGGFINVASYIRGSQIGFLNFADSMEAGIPLGFLSFVRNGYKTIEVYAGEDFQANVNFKTGVQHFYNILAVGVETDDSRRWGYGYGIGSEWSMSKGFKLNTDLISYHIIEGSYRNFPEGLLDMTDLNILNKLRVLATLQLGKSFALFGGPTYNVAVSRYKASAESSPGSALGVSNIFFDRTNSRTNVKMWIGFNAGLRF